MRSKVTTVLASGLAILVGAGLLYAATLPAVGWWKFDEPNGVVANDASGFNHNGTLYGSAAFVQDADMGNVLQIYGPSGEVSVPHDASFEPETGTVEIWVKTNGVQNADIVRKTTDFLMNRKESGTFYAYGIRIRRDGSVEAIITDDDLASNQSFVSVRTKASAVKQNQWIHLALRWDGTTAALFVNGKLATASTYTPIPNIGLSYHGTSDLKVGSLWGDLEFNGSLSDLRIYNSALSEADINSHYSAKTSVSAKAAKGGKTR